MNLRPYQEEAVRAVLAYVAQGKSPLNVAPTGTGKTVMAKAIVDHFVNQGKRGVFMAPRRELVGQAIKTFGEDMAAGICPGFIRWRSAPIQVCTIQTLLKTASFDMPPADFIIVDEAHHIVAKSWKQLPAEHYRDSAVIGLTATPERGDGVPLGDVFNAMHVACSYTYALEQGYLVPARVFRPPESLDGLATDPLTAYQRYGNGETGFLFCRSIKEAEDLAERFTEAGFPSAAVSCRTKQAVRRESIERLAAWDLRMLMSDSALTEGVDVPSASVVLLARAYKHITPLIQSVGRGLRPSPGTGKLYCRVIDLPGALKYNSWMPGQDLEYSLEGKGGIRVPSERGIVTCLECGCTFLSAPVCPDCGVRRKAKERKKPRIFNADLEEVFDFENTPVYAKQGEFERLCAKGWRWDWIAREYKKLFGQPPPVPEESIRRREYEALRKEEAANGRKGYATARYAQAFGGPPPWSWRTEMDKQLQSPPQYGW